MDNINIENLLRNYILQKYRSIRAFSKESGIPQTTIYGMFEKGINNSKMTTIQRICEVLDININDLSEGKITPRVTHEDIVKETIDYFSKNQSKRNKAIDLSIILKETCDHLKKLDTVTLNGYICDKNTLEFVCDGIEALLIVADKRIEK